MKRIITTLTMSAILALGIPMLSTSATAQTRYGIRRGDEVSDYERPNVYQRHRHLFNIAIGTGAGAVVGGLVGGRKGAVIGALIGAGGGALYTYKINPKRPRYYNYRNYR